MRLFIRYERQRAETCDIRTWIDGAEAGVLRVPQKRLADVIQVLDSGCDAQGLRLEQQGSPDWKEEEQ